ncbi:MAG: OmpA family protein [Sphingobacteriaceae bacterium]|nr:OmpA family protein [Sphingobacteriaceae bacterium]
MKKLFFTLSVILSLSSYSQSVEFEKDNFPGRKDELREARRKLEIGIENFMIGRKEFDEYKRGYYSEKKYMPVSIFDYQKTGIESFKKALAPLNEANKFNPKNARLNYMLGFVWFISDAESAEALKHFEIAHSLDPEVEFDILFWLGWCEQMHDKWDMAIKYYNEFLTKAGQKKGHLAEIEDTKKKISECTVGKELSANPVRVFVDNLGSSINTSFPEYGPSITTDEETIIFTARRDNSTGAKRDQNDNGWFEDVYVSAKKAGKWGPSVQLSKNVNTEGHDAAAGLAPDGSKLYVYRHSGRDGGDLYESTLFGADWEAPVHMNKNINTRYHESSVSLSYDGKRIYFVSDKEHGLGDRDIYYSDLDVKGEWGPAKNIGPVINTKYAEEAVFMHPDGVTMYFSSKGHKTMGGYDIFKTTLKNGIWSEPENLGYPINGPDDDVFFVVNGSGSRGYFASAKTGGFGEKDIYKITFLGPEKQPLLNTSDQLLAVRANPVSNLKTESAADVRLAKVAILKGLITSAKTFEPLSATLELIDNDLNIVLATFKSNSATGKYLVTLPSGKNYGIAVKCDGYLFHSENFNLPDGSDYQEVEKNIALKKIEVGSVIVLKNIFFDFDKATIRKESANELERLIKLLNDNPSIKIELGSHTDSKGSDEYNMKLSDNRSKSVVEYLIGKGISAARLVAKGYGETKPIDTNDSDEGRQNNRRTEFKILEK